VERRIGWFASDATPDLSDARSALIPSLIVDARAIANSRTGARVRARALCGGITRGDVDSHYSRTSQFSRGQRTRLVTRE